MGPARVPSATRRSISRSDPDSEAVRVPGAHVWVRNALVYDAVPNRIPHDVRGGDHRESLPALDFATTAAALPATGVAPDADACARRESFGTSAWPRTLAKMAHDPAARAVHRRHGAWGSWHRKNVSVYVSLRRPVAPLAIAGLAAQAWRSCAGGQRRFLHAGTSHTSCRESRTRLPRNRSRYGRLLQPAAQRSRTVRRRVCGCRTRQHSVREIQRASLGAGVHRPAEVW